MKIHVEMTAEEFQEFMTTSNERRGGMIELGQKYRVTPDFMESAVEKKPILVGEVVYIHPKGKYAVLAFPGTAGTARESFPLEQLTDQNRVLEEEE